MKGTSFLVFFVVFCTVGSYGFPVLDITGFTWAENMAFDGKGNLFVSDTGIGAVYRIALSQDGSEYEKYTHISVGQLSKIDGLAMGPNENILYGSARIKEKSWLIEIDTNTPNEFRTLVELPTLGNGLAYNNKTGMLYTTNEGLFLPGNGKVYLIDISKNMTTVVAEDLEGADGCEIDISRQYLYISEVLGGRVIRYTINSDNSITENLRYFAPSMKMLDDFCLSSDGSLIYGADYEAGNVVIFNSDGSSRRGDILMENLLNPTSVRFSVGPGFNSSVVFVSEGGSLDIINPPANRSVLQSPYAIIES